MTYRKSLVSLACCAGMALAAGGASAELVFLEEEDFQGTGLGAVNTVLTIQSPADGSFEAGSVGLDASGTQVITGDAKTGASQTSLRSLGDLGITAASDLRIVFNALEPAGNDIVLTDLVLDIYDPSGTLLFSSGSFDPVTFDSTFPGAGNAGFVFGLDATQAASAQTLAFGGSFAANLVGLSAAASDATGGFETFFVANAEGPGPTPIPEPQTWALMGAGLFAVLLMRRRVQRD